ncbi:uL15 family ribosomal protein, partial [Mycobacterium tuberculosis]|nr:uL15 family ribosomal protein [Mycobacterium tuberculosis]
LAKVEAAVAAGKLDATATITGEALKAAGVIRRVKDGVRLLGPGELTKALTFEVAGASAPAAAAIEKAGGKLTVLAPKKAETEAA